MRNIKLNESQSEVRLRSQELNLSQNIANDVNAQKVLEAMKKGEQYIKPTDSGNHTAIFWGKSGKGKSTSVHLLSGRKVRSYFHEGIGILVGDGNHEQKEWEVTIGTNPSAETIFPAMLKLKPQGGKDAVELWDMPGLGDNRGITQNLINCYFVHRIFQIHKKVKLIFTLDFGLFKPQKRKTQLQPTLLQMMHVFGNFENYQNSVALLITKVTKDNNKSQILKVITSIIENTSQTNQNRQYLKFLQKVNKNNLILIKSADLKGYKTNQQNTIDVSSQYQHLFDEVYKVIAQNLRPASLPQLKPPTIRKKEDITNCQKLVKNAEQLISNSIDIIINQLPNYIKNPYNNIKMPEIFDPESLQQLDKELKRCKDMTQFIDQLMKIIGSDQREDTLKKNFDELKKLFQKNNFQCKKNSRECQSMEDINNKYIITKFFNTFKFDANIIQVKWKNQQQIIRELFNRIMNVRPTFLCEQGNNSVHIKIQQVIVKIFKQGFLEQIKQEGLYFIWKQDYKIFPSFMRVFAIKNGKVLEYFRELQNKCDSLKIKSVAGIKNIIDLINLNGEYLQKSFDNDKFIDDIKNQLMEKEIFLINKATDFSKKPPNELEANICRFCQNGRLENYQKVNKLLIQRKEAKKSINEINQNLKKQQQIFQNKRKIINEKFQELQNEINNQETQIAIKNNYQNEKERITKSCTELRAQLKRLKEQVQNFNQINADTPQEKSCCFCCFSK